FGSGSGAGFGSGSAGSSFGTGSGAAFAQGSFTSGSGTGFGSGSGAAFASGSAGSGTGFGSGSAGSSFGQGSSGSGDVPGANPDSIIAKINQRLDLLAKEGAPGDGRDEQESSFRFDSFDSYDSRHSRDPFRAAFPYGDSGMGNSQRETLAPGRGGRGSFGIPRGNSGNSG
ncbi:AKAP8 protein, partial [Drymodes brunneopygia]|nr:AKAP8 protein [Drymodes brunneopygia]